MPISTTALYPTAFYRGYELGNGVNDWLAVPKGNAPAVIRTTLWANRAIIQNVGTNAWTNVLVDAFRIGVDADPKAFHDWWNLFISNIWGQDPSLFDDRNGELVLIQQKNFHGYTLSVDAIVGSNSMTLTSTTGLSVNNILLIFNKNQASNRASDVVKITGLPGGGVVNFESIRITGLTLHYGFAVADAQIYKAEAAWRDCFLEAAPDIGPAEENSRAHFRKSIPFSFMTNGDRY